MYYERHGGGAPVLMISGSNGDLRRQPPQQKHPIARAFDMLAYDQRGLGQTSVPDGPYTMGDYADDAARLIAAVGWERCHVVGVSFGGMVAQELVLRHPHLVDRLVLACTSSGGAGGSSFDLRGLLDMVPHERLNAWLPLLDDRCDVTVDPPVIAPGLAPALASLGTAGPPTEGYRRQLDARAGHDTWARLATVTSPTFVAAGRFDRQAPLENCERLAVVIPTARLQIFDGGHLFTLQDPTAWPAIVSFLQG